MKRLVTICCLLLAGCATTPKPSSEDSKLDAAIGRYTEGQKRLDAFEADYFNLDADLDKFGDFLAPEYFERDKAMLNDALAAIKEIDKGKLSHGQQISYDLFKEKVETNIEGYQFPREYLWFHQMWNRVRQYIDTSNPKLTSFPFDSVKHYEAYIARAKGFGSYIDRQIANMRSGIAKKVTLNCEQAEKVPNSYKEALETDPEKNPFYRPVAEFPASVPESDRARLRAGFANMIRQDIVPHVDRFDRFFRKEYAPKCRKQFGYGGLPNGAKWYAWLIKANTNTTREAAEIHQLGLNEVKRIEQELGEVRKQLRFKGTHAQFLKSLTEPKYNFTSAQDMFKAFQDARAKIEPKLPAYFSLIPKSDFIIVEAGNPEEAGGSYYSPTEMKPIGRFVANTKNLSVVPTYEVMTLLVHEAIPGHHFQLALQYEMKDTLSEYRRKLYSSTSFVEGWALYAEYLGREMGLFEDPLQRLGNLNSEMLRACRLVVDTGIHAKGWTQARAKKFMSDHLSSAPRDIEIEVNRYSAIPGQALAYKIGQLKIVELRELAKQKLGPKFDIRDFHRQVIGEGTLSLSVLEAKIKKWIEERGA